MQDNRTKNVTRNISFGLINKIVTLLLPFVTRTLMLYLVGVTSVGISTLFSSILSFLSLAELGFGSAVVYSMYKPIADNDVPTIKALLNYYKKLYRVIGTAILLIGSALAPFLPYLIKGETPVGINIYILYFIYLLNSVISYFFAGYRQSLLSAYQRIDVKDKISILVTMVVRFAEIGVIVLTKNLYFYAAVAILGTLITNIGTAIATRRMFPEISCEGMIGVEERHAIRKKLGGLFGTKLNAIVVHQADTIVISSFLGLTILAQYGNYYYILSTVSSFVMILFTSMTASIGNKIATDSQERVYTLFRKISFFNTWIVGWCAVCMLCLYQPFVQLWVGKDLMLPLSTALFMTLYFYIYQIQRTILTFKDAGGLWYEDRFRPYVSMTINLIVNIVLVQYIGLNGVILSTIFAFFISVPWCNHVVFTKMFTEEPIENIKRMILSLIITAGVAAITYFLCNYMPDGIIGLILRAVICIVVPNLLFIAVYHRSAEYQEMKKMLYGMVFGRRKNGRKNKKRLQKTSFAEEKHGKDDRSELL